MNDEPIEGSGLSDLQFVMQDAERVDRGRFGAKDERAEREREATGGFGEAELGRREITFRADENQDRRSA